MNPNHTYRSSTLMGIVVGSVMLVGGLSAAVAEPRQTQDVAMHHQEWLKEKLDQTAERLEIKASQQSAWQAYAKAVQALGGGPGKELDETADAATIARFHAERASAFAAKLKQIADATAKLQSTLTPEQRKTFDQIVRLAATRHDGGHHEHEEMMHGMHGHDGAMGPGEHEHCERHEDNHSEAPPAP